MAQTSLFDTHSELWRRSIEQALPYDAFVATGTPNHQDRWRAYAGRVHVSAEQKELLANFKRTMHVLVLAGTWCGDCARQCPMLAQIAAAAPAINLRFLDNQVDAELRDELRIHGASRVPIAVTISEDFFEVGRSGDRTLAAYRRKAAQELGAACDAGIVPPSESELAAETADWVDHFERHHLLLRLSGSLRTRYQD
jgi:thiol-disulfide isomerase/thioredoxin